MKPATLAKYILLLFVTIVNKDSFAQSPEKNVTQRSVIWLGYVNTVTLSAKWSLTSDVSERFFIDNGHQFQYTIRSKVNYTLGQNWDAGAGFAYFETKTADPASTSTLGVPELRPFQEFNNRQKFNKVSLSHRYRIEERFFRKTKDDKLVDGYNFNFRFRYQFVADYSLYKSSDNKQSLSIRAADEIMFNAGENIVYNIFDQNRISAGLLYQPIKNLSFELIYMYSFQQRNVPKQFNHFDILRFNILHRM